MSSRILAGAFVLALGITSTPAADSVRDAGLLYSHLLKIQASIRTAWEIPEDLESGATCDATVKVAPDGSITSVALEGCEESPRLRRSVLRALADADPLPIPSGGRLYDEFKEMRFPFKAEQ